jgi:hypothetical protein
MTDEELADELIGRLNRLLADPAVRLDVERLVQQRVPCSPATANHPTIQVEHTNRQETTNALQRFFGPEFGPIVAAAAGPHAYEGMTVGFLGLLNGVVGTIPPEGIHAGWGYIAAYFDDDGRLTHFKRTGQP